LHKSYWLGIVKVIENENGNGAFYIGITNDVERRIYEDLSKEWCHPNDFLPLL